jgi:undecaprenyl phosphate N,N'-diacetylbacillosamine 1-phosphate transferase
LRIDEITKSEGIRNKKFFSGRKYLREINLAGKRFVDVFSAFIGLFILAPFFIVIAVLIKINSKGPIFFQQDRLGKNMKVFKILKFRTMVSGAETIGDGLFVYGDNDNRITNIGKFLRRTSLDELPQLVNVLTGDMSIVGPRPPVTYFPYKVEDYDEFKRKRFDMKPGITGKAQVMTRTTASWDRRIEIDVEYVENFNVWLDIKILAYTFITVLLKKNIYPETPGQIKNNNNNNM